MTTGSLKSTALRALRLLDLTDLNDDSTEDAVEALCARASPGHGAVAAVCIRPQFVRVAKEALKGTGVRIATVANFPDGAGDADAAASQVEKAFADGAGEVDVVIPWRPLLAADREPATRLVSACKARTPDGRVLKVILETGELFSEPAIRNAARIAIEAGADFLKTSTGKAAVNATPEAAEILIGEIRDAGRPIGFKAAGGIRRAQDAAAYLAIADRIMGAGWATPETFRFGASGLLDSLIDVIEGRAQETSESEGC